MMRCSVCVVFFFFNDTATTEIYTLSLHDAFRSGCNIHDKMVGYIFVTDAAYFGRTDAGGTWTAANVPRGTYHMSLWHPLLRESAAFLERDVTVTADEAAKLEVQLAQPLRP